MPGGRSQQIVELAPIDVLEELLQRLWSVGPRQTTAASCSTKKPIDITLMPSGAQIGIARTP